MNNGYTAPSDGYIEASATTTSGHYIKFKVNGIVNTVVGGTGFYPSGMLFVRKGMVLQHNVTDYSSYSYIFHPLIWLY